MVLRLQVFHYIFLEIFDILNNVQVILVTSSLQFLQSIRRLYNP